MEGLCGFCTADSHRLPSTAQCSIILCTYLDTDGSSATISAAGVGEAVNLEITPPNLDFPMTWMGSSLAKKFTVKNLGQATVTMTVSVDATAPYTVEPSASFILTSQQSQEVTVTFRPVSTGLFESDVTVSAQSLAVINVDAKGLGIAPEDYLNSLTAAYNVAVGSGAYGVAGTWDKNRDFHLLLAGLPHLDKDVLQDMWEVGDSVLNVTQWVSGDPRLVQFMQTLEDSKPKLDEWMLILSEAISQERFEEEYNRLRAEGLDKLEQAVLEFMQSNDLNYAKDLIRQVASQWPARITLQTEFLETNRLINETRDFLRNQFSVLQFGNIFCGFVPVCGPLQSWFEALNTYLEFVRCTDYYSCIDEFVLDWWKASKLVTETFGSDASTKLDQAVHDLISHVWEVAYQLCQSELRSVDPLNYLVRCFNEAQDDWASAWGLMQWMADPSQSETELRNRVERGFSTMLIAGNAVNQSPGLDGSRWFFLGFEKQSYPYGTWWGAILVYYPSVLVAPDAPAPKVVAVVGGDHCQDCSAKALEIVEWVRTALGVLPEHVDPAHGDKGLVAFAFTYPGAGGVDAVIAALQAEFGSSNIPIIISWLEDGQIKYQCIGTQAACELARKDGSARRAACLQQKRSTTCEAQEVGQQQQSSGSSNELGIGSVDACEGPTCLVE